MNIPDDVRAACWARQQAMGGGCWHCGRPTPEGQRNLHHRLPGGSSVPSNLAGLWPGCHIHRVHDRPADGRAGGWLIDRSDPRDPAEVPVWVQGLGWVWLLDEGCGWRPVISGPVMVAWGVVAGGGRVPDPPGCVDEPRSLFGTWPRPAPAAGASTRAPGTRRLPGRAAGHRGGLVSPTACLRRPILALMG